MVQLQKEKEKKAAEAEFSGAENDLILQAKNPLMTMRLTGASVPQPLRKGKLKKLTREELIEQAKALQKEHKIRLGAGIFQKSFDKYPDDKLIKLLSGQWSGWVRKDLGLKVVPDTHPGRLTHWLSYLFGFKKKHLDRTAASMAELTDGLDSAKQLHARNASIIRAAVIGQACWRGRTTRRWVMPLLEAQAETKARAAALKLRVHKLWRLAVAAGRLVRWIVPARRRIAAREAAAVVLQAAARPAPLRASFLARRAAYRAGLERKRRIDAAMQIQRRRRGQVARAAIAVLHAAACPIQAFWRGWSFRTLDSKRRKAILMRTALGVARKCDTVLGAKPYTWPWRGYEHDDWPGWAEAASMSDYSWRLFLGIAAPRVVVMQAYCRGFLGRRVAWAAREERASRLLQRLARTGPGSIARAELRAARRLAASKVIQRAWRKYRAWKAWKITDPIIYLLHWKASIEISRRWRGVVQRRRCRYLRGKRVWEPWLRRSGLLPPRGSIERAKLNLNTQIRLIQLESENGGDSLHLLSGWFSAWGLPQRHERIQLLNEIGDSETRWEASLSAHESHLERSEVSAHVVAISQIVSSTLRSGYRSWALRLIRAAKSGDVEAAVNAFAWLLSHGASKGIVDDTSLDQDGQTAFGHACAGGHYRTAQLLLDMGANPEHRQKSGRTPFVAACYRGDLQTAQWLYKLPAQKPGMPPINIWSKPLRDSDSFVAAAERGHLNIVQYFVEVLDSSTEHTCGSSSGERAKLPPFVAAVGAGQLEVAKYLFRWGFNTHQPAQLTSDHPDGPGLLHPRTAAAKGGHLQCLRYIASIHDAKCPELAAVQRKAVLKPLPERDQLSSTLDFGTTMAPPKLPVLPIKHADLQRRDRRRKAATGRQDRRNKTRVKKKKKQQQKPVMLAEDVKAPPLAELEQYITAIEQARPRFFRDATRHLRTAREQEIPSLMPGLGSPEALQTVA